MATKSTDSSNRVEEKEEASKRVEEKEEGVDVNYDLLGLTMKFNDEVASCRLRMPSVLPRGFTTHGKDSDVVLILLSDEDLMYNFKLMKKTVHPNILYGRLVHKNQLAKGSRTSSVDQWGLVEQYTGLLLDFLKKNLGIPRSRKSDVVLLPHDILRNIVRQMVDGLEHLMVHGCYHGNLKLKNTLYHQKPNGKFIVKLTGFKRKGEKISVCQTQDLWALGDVLEEISDIAKELNKVAAVNKSGLHFDTFQLDDLIRKLRLVTVANLPVIYPQIKGHVFFWEVVDRKTFFVYRVPMAMKNKSFEGLVDNCEDICSSSWDSDGYDGYLQKAIKYRKDNKKKALNGSSRSSFVKFICGLYTHEQDLKEVDQIVLERHPHLCVLLRNLLGADNGDWL